MGSVGGRVGRKMSAWPYSHSRGHHGLFLLACCTCALWIKTGKYTASKQISISFMLVLSLLTILILLSSSSYSVTAVTEPGAEGVGRKKISHVPSYVTCFIFTIILNQEENTSARLQNNNWCPQK